MTDILDADSIRDRLSATTLRWLEELELFETIDSTNSHLMRAALRGDITGRVCLAEFQSAGRGRRGRTWTTPRGQSIALSLAYAFDVQIDRLGAVSLVTGLAVADALERCGVEGVTLKWPNDVLLKGAKLGGILIEVVPVRRPPIAVIGVGINVRRGTELASVSTPVAAVDDVRGMFDRNDLAANLIETICAFATRFVADGFSAFHGAWERRDAYRDQEVAVLMGTERIIGRVRGVTDLGELILETAAGRCTFNSGEVSLRSSRG